MASSLERAAPYDDAVRLLARREYARAELAGRLGAMGHAPAAIESCLDELAARGLQSDDRFVESFLRSRIGRGQGPVKIRAELEWRGIGREAIRAAFDDLASQGELDWFALAAETLARRFSGPGDTPRERARRERFLAGRGFDAEQVRHALAQWRNADD